MDHNTDALIVGAGLAGLVAACELIEAGRRVIVIDQESEANLGGQAWWSFGGLFFVNSPEQRRVGIRDSLDLAWQDWIGTAGFDREEDHWPKKWAEAYVHWAAGGKREWVRSKGIGLFPIVGWAERGGHDATGPGNSVPRFHITWGTGPGLVQPFIDRARAAADEGRLRFAFRHRVDELIVENGAVTGVRGQQLAPDHAERGVPTNRETTEPFELHAQAVIVTSGGIGASPELVRKNWPQRLGSPPRNMIAGVPDYVDGRMLGIAEEAGAHLINR
ncbi:MAG: FAD-binding protein, partial [Salinisphaera sp.]|nr:FAD-binding protein [Salinisphaera sp.]